MPKNLDLENSTLAQRLEEINLHSNINKGKSMLKEKGKDKDLQTIVQYS